DHPHRQRAGVPPEAADRHRHRAGVRHAGRVRRLPQAPARQRQTADRGVRLSATVTAMTLPTHHHSLPATQRSGTGRRAILAAAAALVCTAALEPQRNVWAQASDPASASGAVTLFENVRIFDGKGAALSAPSNVLIRGKVIERISTQSIPVDRRADTRVIDGGGRTLMPGLIDVHWHAMLARTTPAQSLGDVGYNNLVAGDEATDTLMRGFTTVRDMGGPAFGLKRAIDEGIVKGPRIYPSGAFITVTSGHGDFRQLTDLPRTIGGMLTR